jgi:hypothetical protein
LQRRFNIPSLYEFFLKAGDLAFKTDFDMGTEDNFFSKLVFYYYQLAGGLSLQNKTLDLFLKIRKVIENFTQVFLNELNRNFKTMQMHEYDLFVVERCMSRR